MNEVGRVLCAVDFSAATPSVLRPAISVARKCGAEIVLLHVVDVSADDAVIAASSDADGYGEGTAQEAVWRVEELAGRARRTALRARARFKRGVFHEEILSVAREEDVDLIVMATTHTPAGPDRVRLGDAADKVLRKAPCPVLTVCPDSETPVDVDVERVLQWVWLAGSSDTSPYGREAPAPIPRTGNGRPRSSATHLSAKQDG